MHSTSPAAMTPEERLSEIARLLAEGYVRLRSDCRRAAQDCPEPADPAAEGTLPDSRTKTLQFPPGNDSCQCG